MRDALMRLVALAALSAVADMLAVEGGAKQTVRFIGGLLEGAKDGAAIRAAEYAVDNLLPVIGGDVADTVGAYMAILMMPLCYSIATGIMFAILAWVILKVCERKASEVSPIMWGVFVLFCLRIVTLITNFQ